MCRQIQNNDALTTLTPGLFNGLTVENNVYVEVVTLEIIDVSERLTVAVTNAWAGTLTIIKH